MPQKTSYLTEQERWEISMLEARKTKLREEIASRVHLTNVARRTGGIHLGAAQSDLALIVKQLPLYVADLNIQIQGLNRRIREIRALNKPRAVQVRAERERATARRKAQENGWRNALVG